MDLSLVSSTPTKHKSLRTLTSNVDPNEALPTLGHHVLFMSLKLSQPLVVGVILIKLRHKLPTV